MFSLRPLAAHLRTSPIKFPFSSVARLVKPLHTAPPIVPPEQLSQNTSTTTNNTSTSTSTHPSSLGRFRRSWTEEEQLKLEKLIEIYGERWTEISKHFDMRSPAHIKQRCLTMKGSQFLGPWSKEELDLLRDLVGDAKDVDWVKIRDQLPLRRPIPIIKQTWIYSLDPTIKHGKWSEEESAKLTQLVEKHGPNNWTAIGNEFKTRTKRQCLERWKWQMADIKKGQYSDEEDKLIMDAIKEHGNTNFLLIQKATGIKRTPRHISQHYNAILNPKFDRSPWTLEEELDFYHGYQKHGDMVKVSKMMNSKRYPKDIWNHYYRTKRVLEGHSTPRLSKAKADKEKESETEQKEKSEESTITQDTSTTTTSTATTVNQPAKELIKENN
ncbi:Homeodomain-like DNA binding domain-containing transcription factor [Phycomyces blakesleeanus]|uniref:Homeodomain-like DNA binding domain-containing transcription factor n=2 Tax=Phycomyces blakesleeanus TaxID=4837 RepID=A0A162NG65_PHYB8|nr:Homeodomain-like DNA binding domain-containing transcription factor [Phycomyces blakesleeanus NRRL 1555(-)]OAD69264.1 Homeodomain-like DNA binding domain-containing transcription factor [Phycomyces blakesleeanus NRRL 1555(-)]|eukprot:XP_018287304.1 Homeodomain-like DNA binding domain-containing transcription factor [Phycomyces blakesleeanus NRRL 1555(-)]